MAKQCAALFLPVALFVSRTNGFFSPLVAQTARLQPQNRFRQASAGATSILAMSTSAAATKAPSSWTDLSTQVGATDVGKALNDQVELRRQGLGSAHVHSTLRKFDSPDQEPKITLFRDHAGWCPYCQKMMMLVEEKRIPVKLELVNMRSYGDKPNDFLRKVPGGLLPAMEVNGQVITESQVIMELLDQWHTVEDGYRPMLPNTEATQAQYTTLARLERELFSYWCGLIFRPEGNPLAKLMGGGSGSGMSSAMEGFLDCIKRVDKYLLSTKGPWFFGELDHPTMIDFIYVSHVERMLASCAYWKGLDLRDPKWGLEGLNAWLEAFEKREAYLAYKSDYYTHVRDIPPQYGPGYDGGFDGDREKFFKSITGKDDSWTLPLTHDDPLQPLYKGIPLPLCVLEAVGITADANGSYETADPKAMEQACRTMAAWKLSGNGGNVSKFAARGGPKGAKNIRKSFGAQLADPYANPDEDIQPSVDMALRIVCSAMAAVDEDDASSSYAAALRDAVPSSQVAGVASSLAYLRDRVGVPRDLPLASARYLRAYLNWGIDTLSS